MAEPAHPTSQPVAPQNAAGAEPAKTLLYVKVMDDELRQMLNDAAAGASGNGCNFFDKFEYFQLYNKGYYSQAIDSCLDLFEKLKNLSPDGFQKIHKGTPFYWLSLSSYFCHDYSSALYLEVAPENRTG